MTCTRCAPAHATLVDPTATTILLVGNPNVGKSTLFNALTGARQTVRNAPGTTVEVFSGTWKSLGVRLIDTPGTYSLLPNSPDEEVVVDTLAGAPGSLTDPTRGAGVGLVVAVLDATALSRSLYLLGQLAQTGVPLVCALSMYDIASANNTAVDPTALSAQVGVPVVVIDPRRRRGIDALETAVRAALSQPPRVSGLPIDPGAPGYNELVATHRARCCGETHPETTDAADETERATLLFDWIGDVMRGVGEDSDAATTTSLSDRIDRFLLNPFLGIASFLVAMYIVFWLCNTFATIFQDPLEQLFDSPGGWTLAIPAGTLLGWPGSDITLMSGPSLAQGVSALLEWAGWGGGVVEGILVDGLLTGVGVVASFAPLMIVMFIAIGMLEDSGYMARIAFLGDRVMRLIGLDGRVIMPFVVGFGCNLPTLAAMRTLPNSRHRIVAVILTPYITCNARLVVYLMIANVFFPTYTTAVVWTMYVCSILMVILGGLVLKPIFMRGEQAAPPHACPPALPNAKAHQDPRVFGEAHVGVPHGRRPGHRRPHHHRVAAHAHPRHLCPLLRRRHGPLAVRIRASRRGYITRVRSRRFR